MGRDFKDSKVREFMGEASPNVGDESIIASIKIILIGLAFIYISLLTFIKTNIIYL